MKLISGNGAGLLVYFVAVMQLCGAALGRSLAGDAYHTAVSAGRAEHEYPVLSNLDTEQIPLHGDTGKDLLQDLLKDGAATAQAAREAVKKAAHHAGQVLDHIDFDRMTDKARRVIKDKTGVHIESDIGIVLAVTAGLLGAGFLLAFGLHIFLPLIGFTAEGVTAGSIAAGWQSTIGNVVAGSTFATLQSVGAAGLSAGVVAATVAGAGAAAGAAAYAAQEK